MPCNRVNWLCVVLQAMYPAPRTADCRKSSAKRPLSETAAVPDVDMKEDREPRNAAMTPAVTMRASVIATINSTMENPRARGAAGWATGAWEISLMDVT